MSSTDDDQPSPPEVSDATQAADVPDVPDNLLNQLMDQHDAEQQLQNLQLQSGSGSQETGTEAAIPLQQGTGSPATPISRTETMDDTYAPTDDDDEEEDSTDSVEFIAETQVQEEEIQSTQLVPPQSSQMLESHQESAAAPVRDPTEDSDEALRAIMDQQQQVMENAQRERMTALNVLCKREMQGGHGTIRARSRVTYVRA